ncbi:MAG: HhH-GPD-type base excision DNA repair protein [Streptosporangiaceae bacterium]
MPLSLPVEAEANELLSRSPLALLLAMVLDQQVPLEKAFSSPYQLARRLGHEPAVAELASYDPEALAAIFAERPALHRFPRAMAARVQDLARLLLERYDGDAEQVWATAATGAQLRDNLTELPGFGRYKAQITMALLGKQLGIQPAGWREAAGPFGHEGSHVSVADIVDEDSLARVRAHKKQVKAAAKESAGRPG